MKVLMIGCGKLGLRIAEILAAQKNQIWALKRHPENLPAFVTPIQGDLSAPPTVDWTSFDLIYLIVSPDQRTELAYQELYQENIPALSARLGRHLKSDQQIIFVSSTHVYSENQGGWINSKTSVQPYDYRSKAILTAEKSLVDSTPNIFLIRLSGLYDQHSQYIMSQLKSKRILSANHYTNRIHREDAARFLAYLSTYTGKERIFVASDNQPTQRGELMQWLAKECEMEPIISELDKSVSGKCCDNQSMRDTGFVLQYPDYKSGYQSLIEKIKAQKA